jgi:hypothetical protein
MAQTTLAEDKLGRVIQALALGTSQDLAFGTGSSTTSAAPLASDCRAVRVLADQDCRVAIGPTATVAAAATGARLSAGIAETFRVPFEASAGPLISISVAARGVTAAGTLNIVELV